MLIRHEKRLKIEVFDPHPKTFVVVVSHESVSNFLNICYEVNYQKICLLLDGYTVSKIRNAHRHFLKRAAFSRSSAKGYPTHLNIFKCHRLEAFNDLTTIKRYGIFSSGCGKKGNYFRRKGIFSPTFKRNVFLKSLGQFQQCQSCLKHIILERAFLALLTYLSLQKRKKNLAIDQSATPCELAT